VRNIVQNTEKTAEPQNAVLPQDGGRRL